MNGWAASTVDYAGGEIVLETPETLAARLGSGRAVEVSLERDGPSVDVFLPLRAAAGNVHPTGAPELAQERPDAMFQRIVHDGLVGDAFLRRRPVTYDLPRSRMVFGRPA